VTAGKTASVTHTATVSNPKLWSPSSPTLYSVVTTVSVGGSVVDTYTTPLGIRTFAFDANTGFSLNGTKMKLNGTCNHHDLGALGAAVNSRAIEKRLQMLKDMGVNALRTSHNPPAPELLDIADRLGLMVMDEAFDCWYAGKNTYDYGRFFNQWYDTDVQGYVARDRNHPSVIIWSIGNEVAQAGDKATVQKLITSVHAKDTTRPITQAYAAWVDVSSITGLEDLVGINYAPDRYDSVHTSNPTYKMFASESSSALRSRGIYNNNNNQESSYDDSAAGWGHTAETSWKNVNTRAWIAGEFIWTGFDYIGEPTPYEWPSKSSYFGAIDTAYFPKDVFYFYQSKWNASGPTMVHIVPMNWTNWTAGQAVKVWSTATPTASSSSSTTSRRVRRRWIPAFPNFSGRSRSRPARSGEGHQGWCGRRDRHSEDRRGGGGLGTQQPTVLPSRQTGATCPSSRWTLWTPRASSFPKPTTRSTSRSVVLALSWASTLEIRQTTIPTRARRMLLSAAS
jgi:beta-galactosidase